MREGKPDGGLEEGGFEMGGFVMLMPGGEVGSGGTGGTPAVEGGGGPDALTALEGGPLGGGGVAAVRVSDWGAFLFTHFFCCSS